jgi:hypothetical protein
MPQTGQRCRPDLREIQGNRGKQQATPTVTSGFRQRA